jgi:hypothetical protein
VRRIEWVPYAEPSRPARPIQRCTMFIAADQLGGRAPCKSRHYDRSFSYRRCPAYEGDGVLCRFYASVGCSLAPLRTTKLVGAVKASGFDHIVVALGFARRHPGSARRGVARAGASSLGKGTRACDRPSRRRHSGRCRFLVQREHQPYRDGARRDAWSLRAPFLEVGARARGKRAPAPPP